MKHKAKTETIKTPTLYRVGEITTVRAEDDEDSRLVDVAFSSEEPVKRFFGIEILDHKKKSVSLEFLDGGRAPLLLDHNTGDQIGVVEKASIDGDRVGRATVRFGKSAHASEVLNDVRDGIRANVSVGYSIEKLVTDQVEGDVETLRAVNWTPLEISFVSVPADTSVGVGRDGDCNHKTLIERTPEAMPPENVTETPADAPESPAPAAPAPAAPTPEPIDAEKAAKDATKAERARIEEIEALGRKFNLQDDAREAIAESTSIEQFRFEVVEKLGDQLPVSNNPNNLDLSNEETRQYNFLAMCRAAANPQSEKLAEAAAFEIECSAEISTRLGKQPNGFFVPLDVQQRQDPFSERIVVGLQKRDLTSTATSGGELIGTSHLAGSFIELLRNATIVKTLGARVLSNLVGNISIPKLSAGASGSWVAENAAPSETTHTTASVTMSPKHIAAFTEIGRTLLIQSDPSVDQMVREDLALSAAITQDAGAINGSGTNQQPTGILNTTGIGSVADAATAGGAITWAKIVDNEKEVAIDNALLGSLGYLTNPKVVGSMKQTPKQSSGVEGNFIYQGGELNGYPVGNTNQVPSNLTKGSGTGLSALIFGNFADLIIAEWGTLDVLVNPFADSTKGLVRITVFLDTDIAVRHAQSFTATQDLIAG